MIDLRDEVRPEDDEQYQETELLSSERYTSREWLALEYERLWPYVWQQACREEDIPEPGDFHEYTIGKRSIIVLRDDGGQIRAFHNTCMHRGTLLIEGQGNVRELPCSPGNEGKLQCPFHGWSYNLDGTSHYITGRADFAPGTLDKDSINLRPVQVDTCNGFVYINMDPNCISLREWLGPIPEATARFNIDKMRTLHHTTIIVDANWKMALEQFNEAYHAWTTHIIDMNKVGGVASGAGGRQAGQKPGQITPERIMYMFQYRHFERHTLFFQLDWQPTAGLPPISIKDMPGDPREFIGRALRHMYEQRRVAPYELEYFDNLTDLPYELDLNGPEFLVWLRRNACDAVGVDLSHLENEDMFGFVWEFMHFPNTTGPLAGNSYLNLRMRPNGMDPDSCIFEIRSLFLFPEGQTPAPEREFIADWKSNQDRIPVEFLQDFAMYPRIQRGLYQDGFAGHRLNRQEDNNRHYERLIDGYVKGGAGTR